jgi:HEPN domain-containing protein
MKRATREWVQKAEDDFRLAELIDPAHTNAEHFHDQTCLHCQQSVEKYLKAILEDQGRPVPKTHDLDELLDLLKIDSPTLKKSRRGLLFLSDYAVNARYPGKRASKRQAVAALRWARQVRSEVRAILGIG